MPQDTIADAVIGVSVQDNITGQFNQIKNQVNANSQLI
jgi:NAD(P)H-hydrate repair Nnr-like enzyme with NAD(P)H-hydrate epimerase domain